MRHVFSQRCVCVLLPTRSASRCKHPRVSVTNGTDYVACGLRGGPALNVPWLWFLSPSSQPVPLAGTPAAPFPSPSNFPTQSWRSGAASPLRASSSPALTPPRAGSRPIQTADSLCLHFLRNQATPVASGNWKPSFSVQQEASHLLPSCGYFNQSD